MLLQRILRQLLPLFGFLYALYEVWFELVSATDIVLFASMYVVAMFGFEAGFHRYFAHNAFRASPLAKAYLGITGTMAGAGSIIWWSTMHRVHHRYADEGADPHSPLHYGTQGANKLRGWWHAYFGFLTSPLDYDPETYSPDLLSDALIVRISQDAVLWFSLGVFAPGIIAFVLTGSWMEFVSGVVWGGLARIFCGRLATLSVQCFCHVWGSRPYTTPGKKDSARNNLLFVPFSLGMGWHNNHHAFPYTYSNSFRWWQVDFSAWGLKLLLAMGLIHSPKFPSSAALQQRRNTVPSSWWYN